MYGTHLVTYVRYSQCYSLQKIKMEDCMNREDIDGIPQFVGMSTLNIDLQFVVGHWFQHDISGSLRYL